MSERIMDVSRWLRGRAVLDRVVAVGAACVAVPVCGVLALRVRRDDPGPAFVTLPRVGRDGRVFPMHKVRTMRSETADGLAAGSRITAGDDGRITRVGARLRRFHLDELPQLLDVALGRMTLLGPRPETPELVDFDEAWDAVLRVAPGIAGPTQLVVDAWESRVLRGVNPEAAYRADVLPVKLAIDRWYVEHATPWTDVLIVVSLFERFVLGRDRCVLDGIVRRAVPAARAIDEFVAAPVLASVVA